jgi:hypothetical protein
MGLRGPLRNPNSVRGKREAAKAVRGAVELAIIDRQPGTKPFGVAQKPAVPTCPEWLSPDQAELFASLVSDLQAADVPVKNIDSHAIMMAVQCLSGVREATELAGDSKLGAEHRLAALKLKAQLGKDLIQWLQLICATPGARARIGIKAAPEKKLGPLALMLAAKQRAVQHGS